MASWSRRSALVSIAGTLLTSSALAARQQPPPIRVRVPLVTVPTLVFSSRGKLVYGLSAADFQLFDEGRKQTVELEAESNPLSVVIVVQTSQAVRAYLPTVANAGSTLENSLRGENGELAVLAYEDDVSLMKPFGTGDAETVLHKITAGGEKARMIDAGLQAVTLLDNRTGPRSKIILFIGQPFDSGSHASLDVLQTAVGRENISCYALVLPIFGKKFISDAFTLEGLGSQGTKGGYKASVELTKAVPALKHASKRTNASDPFSLLTSQTGGIEAHFRKQGDLENALIALGGALHSIYTLSFAPDALSQQATASADGQYHKIRVTVDVPGATVHARLGYRSVN